MRLLLMPGGDWATNRRYDQPMNISLDTFEDRIAWLLKQRGMSQKELAARLDVSVQFLNSLVIGRRRPNVKRLTQIATALHTSVDFLALTSDDPAPPQTEPAPDLPVYFSPEADAAAQLIDAMRDERLRGQALDLIRLVASWEAAEEPGRNQQRHTIEPVPGAHGGGLVLRELAKQRTRT